MTIILPPHRGSPLPVGNRRGLPSYQASIQSIQTAVSRCAAALQGSMRHLIAAPFQTVKSLVMIHLENHNLAPNSQLHLHSRPFSRTKKQQTSFTIIPITPQTPITARYPMSLVQGFIGNSANSMSRWRGSCMTTNTFKIHVTWGYLLMGSLYSAKGIYLPGQSSLSTSTSHLMLVLTLPTSCALVSFLHQQLSSTLTHSSILFIASL